MMVSPAFMVGVSGSLDVTYDDFDEIKEHPMAAPALVSFADLFEGMTGKSREDALSVYEKKAALEAARQPDAEGEEKAKTCAIDAILAGLDLLENLGEEGHIEWRVLLKDRGLIEVSFESPGVQKAALLAIAAGPFRSIARELGAGGDEDDY